MTTMAAAVLLTVGLVGLAATPAWAAPPTNDNFADATPVTGSFTDTVNTTEATFEFPDGEDNFCAANNFESVWYALTTAVPGTATIDTIGSDFDTVLEVYTGPALDSLTLITCNDNISPGDTDSTVTFSVAASTTYYIRASGSFNATGNLVINGDAQLRAARI